MLSTGLRVEDLVCRVILLTSGTASVAARDTPAPRSHVKRRQTVTIGSAVWITAREWRHWCSAKVIVNIKLVYVFL